MLRKHWLYSLKLSKKPVKLNWLERNFEEKILSYTNTNLGVQTDEKLNSKFHIHDLISKFNWSNLVLPKLRYFESFETLRGLYFDCMFLLCHVRVSEWIHTL